MSTSPRDPADHSGPDLPEGNSGAGASHLDPWDPDLLRHLGVVVPDDVRALERHVPKPPARGSRVAGVLTLCAMAVALLLIAILGGSLSPQSTASGPTPYPLATEPAAAPGLVGGLLPDTPVRLDDGTRGAARGLRPSVLFVPPTTACADCAAELDNLWRQAHEYGLPVYLVAPLGGTDQARRLMRSLKAAQPSLIVDSRGGLVAAYGADVGQVVLVAADGVVTGVLRSPAANARLEQLISPLRLPGAPPSLRSATNPA